MSVVCFCGDKNFFQDLKGVKPNFFLGASVTKSCEIEGITQAGIPGSIHLTPTLDSEFIVTERVFSMPKIAKTLKGVPTPALITRAIANLLPFKEIKILDLGLSTKPQIPSNAFVDFQIEPSESIVDNKAIDTQKIFYKGVDFGRSTPIYNEYIIFGESTPAGTTTAAALTKALGYTIEKAFSSSFKNSPLDKKKKTITKALEKVQGKDLLEKIGGCSDNMLIFTAGFLLGISRRCKVVLGGGTQMAAALLLADTLGAYFNLSLKNENIALATTKWVYEDPNSDIEEILKNLSFTPNGFYSDFDFSLSQLPPLQLYDEGEGKEGVGAGSALCYGLLNALSKEAITKEIEKYLL